MLNAFASIGVLSFIVTQAIAGTAHLRPLMHNGTVSIEELSTDGNLDGFKMNTSANSSSFDYWWFDVVSSQDDAALNIVFYNAGDIGNSQPLAVEISGTFQNGTRFFKQVLEHEGAVITNDEQGIFGHWRGIGARFTGTNLKHPDVQYQVTFDSEALGLWGTIKLKSRAPAHYPCDPDIPGVTQLHLPRFFWSNAVPDADASVDLRLNGTEMRFTGIGYHDKNWGDRTILKSPKYWDWGHSRVGPYSVVWYDLLDYDNTEFHRSYIAKDGEIMVVSCANDSVTTRPWGGNATWPSANGLNSATGVLSIFDIGDGDKLMLNVTKNHITYDVAVYTRATGSVKASIESTGETYDGKAFFDEFTYGVMFGGEGEGGAF